MVGDYPSLFGPSSSTEDLLPEGFRYQPNLLSMAEEEALVGAMWELPFKQFDFHGFTGKRRVVSFGWRYDFGKKELRKADEMPAFLLPLRGKAAAFIGLPPDEFQHALLTEYGPGAPIGWHKDRAVFDKIVGVSLVSPCSFRFRRRRGAKWERASLILEPRSAYLLDGASRTEWEHSIPPVNRLRYSVTFRSFPADPALRSSSLAL
jgi:alkylated DNA repair dioxygenase AlkB